VSSFAQICSGAARTVPFGCLADAAVHREDVLEAEVVAGKQLVAPGRVLHAVLVHHRCEGRDVGGVERFEATTDEVDVRMLCHRPPLGVPEPLLG
jgi:hypothetical protein